MENRLERRKDFNSGRSCLCHLQGPALKIRWTLQYFYGKTKAKTWSHGFQASVGLVRFTLSWIRKCAEAVLRLKKSFKSKLNLPQTLHFPVLPHNWVHFPFIAASIPGKVQRPTQKYGYMNHCTWTIHIQRIFKKKKRQKSTALWFEANSSMKKSRKCQNGSTMRIISASFCLFFGFSFLFCFFIFLKDTLWCPISFSYRWRGNEIWSVELQRTY